MNTTTFDTLSAARSLEAAGIEAKQADWRRWRRSRHRSRRIVAPESAPQTRPSATRAFVQAQLAIPAAGTSGKMKKPTQPLLLNSSRFFCGTDS